MQLRRIKSITYRNLAADAKANKEKIDSRNSQIVAADLT